MRHSLDLARWKERKARRGPSSTDEAALELICLALRTITADWRRPAHYWRATLDQFAILSRPEPTVL